MTPRNSDRRPRRPNGGIVNRHQIADLLLKHGRRGAVPTKSVSVRLPVTDLERARKLAEKRGVGYQTVIKTLLHEALKRESKIATR